jgi:hypothetical protein
MLPPGAPETPVVTEVNGPPMARRRLSQDLLHGGESRSVHVPDQEIETISTGVCQRAQASCLADDEAPARTTIMIMPTVRNPIPK